METNIQYAGLLVSYQTPLSAFLVRQQRPSERSRARRDVSVVQSHRRLCVGAVCRAGVEAVPSAPHQGSPDETEGQVVVRQRQRMQLSALEQYADDEAGHASRRMDDQAYVDEKESNVRLD